MKKISASFFDLDTVSVARNMIGKILVHETSEGVIAGVIKETEAYTHRHAQASNAGRGRPRTTQSSPTTYRCRCRVCHHQTKTD